MLVAAVARNRVIGNGPDIPWSLPGEQAEFKRLTLGHTLVMGRATYESIGRPLPGRTTIVLTRDPHWTADGVLVVRSLPAALACAATTDGDIVVAGGAQVYAEALPLADLQIITEVPLEPEGDAYYPVFDERDWVQTRREQFDGFQRVWYARADPERQHPPRH